MNKSIDALIGGFKDGGCEYVTNFPGFNSHELFFGLGGDRISINERVAYEMSYGASLAGKRAVVSFKGTGLNFAADVFLHSVINGINAGLVLVLTDDIEAVSSPERQDSRPYFDLYGGLWLEPTTIQQAYDFAYQSLKWSEELDVPIVIRLTNQFFRLEGEYLSKTQVNVSKSLENRRDKYVSYWKKRQDNLNLKNLKISQFVETLYSDVDVTDDNKIIIYGNCQEEIKDVKKDFDALHLYTLPLPVITIGKYISTQNRVSVYEQGNGYVANKVKQYTNNIINIISDTGSYKDNSANWTIFNNQEKFFTALSSVNPSYVVGDEGTFTDESTKTIDVCLSMGSSMGITAGLSANGVNYPWCVTGDTSFNLSAYQSISEAKDRHLNFGIIVIDNGVAKSTGGQNIIGNIRDISGVNKIETVYDQTSLSKYQEILGNMTKTPGISILYIKVN